MRSSKYFAYLDDGTVWPSLSSANHDICWKLRHAQDKLTKTELMVAASILDAYFYSVGECTNKRRNSVANEIKRKNNP